MPRASSASPPGRTGGPDLFAPRTGLPRPVRTEVARLVAACRAMAIPIRPAHLAILELTAAEVVRYYALGRELQRQGMVYRAKAGTGELLIRKNPALAELGKAWGRAVAGLTKLGLTPADFERVGGHSGGAPGAAPPRACQAPVDGLSEFDGDPPEQGGA